MMKHLLPHALWLLLAVRTCVACPVCMPLPRATMADQLIGSSDVVCAVLASGDRFSYQIKQVLKGNARVGQKLDVFVDSTNRRKLQADRERFAIFVRKPDKEWKSLGLGDAMTRVVVERIIAHSAEWKSPAGAKKRAEFFARLLEHRSPQIQQLALLELGKAPYREIRRLGKLVPQSLINQLLQRREYYEWRSLGYLFLAQQKTDTALTQIDASFTAAIIFGANTNLAALTLAALELDEARTFDMIENRLETEGAHLAKEKGAHLRALSVYGNNGSAGQRDRIERLYELVLSHHPQFAGPIARDLLAWQRWKLHKRMQSLLEDPPKLLSGDDLQAVRSYVRKSEQEP